MDPIVQKVHKYMTGLHMIEENYHVVAGISGGADSMCLLFVLNLLRRTMNIKITAVHINHGLRGEAADGDERFVRQWCEAYEIECVSFRENIKERARSLKISEEECGRLFRYECFEKVRAGKNAHVIAVAHHQDDLAETVIFNLVRGSALKGLSGITPVRDKIIRPLLCLRRSEIEALLQREGIDYRTDATNFEEDYTRNKIRLKVLPYLNSEINQRATEHIASLAGAALEASDYIARQAKKAWEQVADEKGRIYIPKFSALDPVIQKELVRLLIEKKAGKLKDITQKHVQSVCALAFAMSGREIHLPYQMTAVKESDWLSITDGKKENVKCGEIPAAIPGRLELETPDGRLTLEILKTVQIPAFLKNPCTKCFDYDKINDGLLWRHRRSGDFMCIGDGRKKLVKRLLIDEKVPKSERDSLWLLADGDHVLWIPGLPGGRISDYYKITDATKQVLMIKIKGEEENGRQDQSVTD